MKIRTKILLSFLILLTPIAIIGTTSFWSLNRIRQDVNQRLTQNIQTLENATKLNSLAQFIRYYDEVLTQSARNYAFTADRKWHDRYEQNAVLLDSDIKKAIQMGDEEDNQLFKSVDTSNIALVKMEENSMNLVSQGNQPEAIGILGGGEYTRQKAIYQDALVKYFEKQGKKYSEALTISTEGTTQTIAYIQEAIGAGIMWTIVSLIAAWLLTIILGLIISSRISQSISILVKTAKEITAGNLSTRANIHSKDEVGELAASLNEMADKLQEIHVKIEAKVKKRTAELEKINKFMTGRELKMIELKKKITELENVK